MVSKSLLIGRGGRFRRRGWILAAGGVLVLVVVVVSLCVSGRSATVDGRPPAERIESISRLAAEQPSGAGEAISRAAIGDRDARVRCAALAALRTCAQAESRTAVEQGTRDEVSRVRAAAALTLGAYADGAAVGRLGEMLAGDRDDEVRLAAARGLARCNSRQADDLLVAAMRGNSSPAVQKRSLLLLLEGTGVRLVPEPDPRDAAVWARHVGRVLRHVSATRANQTPRKSGRENDR